MGPEWPLYGRARELRLIEKAVRNGTRSRGVVLAGAAGVGKTRLAREAGRLLGRHGMATRWASATASAQTLPLGAFAGLVGDVSGHPTRLLRQASEALLGRVSPGRVVVAVDDAHLLDDVSAWLIHHIVMQDAAAVVVTLRTGEPAPDAVTALWKDLNLQRLELEPFSESETAALLEEVLGGRVDDVGAARVWALTQGNALYLRHLIDGELESGRLQRSGERWRWIPGPAIPPGLAELVAARMGHLSPAIRDVVDVLSLGEPLGVSVLSTLTDRAVVEEAEARGLVRVGLDLRRMQARLAHPLYGEVCRSTVGQLRARRLRSRIDAALAATGARRSDDTLRRAVLSLDSDTDPDVHLLTLAAQTAIGRLDLPLAERLARAAAAAGGFEACFTLAVALSWLSRGAEAEVQLASLADRALTDEQRLSVALPRFANLFWAAQRPAEAQLVLDAAETEVNDENTRPLLCAARSALHGFWGRPEKAIASAEQALAASWLPDEAVMLAAFGRMTAIGGLGRASELDPLARRVYDAAGGSILAAVSAFGFCDLHMNALRIAGYLNGLESLAQEQYQRACDMPGFVRLCGVALRGQAALYRGRLRIAIRALGEAQIGLLGVDTQGFAYRCLLNLTQALAMAGEVGEARRSLTETEAKRHPAFRYCEPELLLARAWVAAADGASSEAISVARSAAVMAADQGYPGYEVIGLHTAACFGDRTVADRLSELALEVDNPRARAAAAHAVGLAADDAIGLLRASDMLDDMGDRLAAADAAAQAAAIQTRKGRLGPGRAAAVRAHEIADSVGARTPALCAAIRPLPLTSREREVVTLAAHGLSNRQIATRLVVSVRTVEGHLYRASSKLGVSDRAEFAALLRFD